MSRLQITFKPLDTLFFRDGSPFNRKELQANVGSIFPPSPTTLGGAIRAAWAKALGWDGKGKGSNWNEKCKDKLGAGTDLAEITFEGPYLFKDGLPIFPTPAHLLGVPPSEPDLLKTDSPTELILLKPEKTFKTDINGKNEENTQKEAKKGGVFLATTAKITPETPFIEGRKALIDEYWITAAGMNQILAGALPDENTLIHQSKLWSVEHRIGNFRETGRVTKLNALYAPQHIRLADDVSLVMYADNLPDEDDIITAVQQNPAPTGGEARSCWLTVEKDKSISDYLIGDSLNSSAPSEQTEYTLIALTPLQLEKGLEPDMKIADGKLQTACNPRAIMLGGWDNDKPRALVPHIPAGSVLFITAGTTQSSHKIETLGNNPQWGFGKAITGKRN